MFEVSIHHPSGGMEYTDGSLSLEFSAEVRAGGINF